MSTADRHTLPARAPGTVSRAVDGGFVVIHLASSTAHALSGTHAAVWDASESGAWAEPADPDIPAVVAELQEIGLLCPDIAGISRRALLNRAGIAGGAVVAANVAAVAAPGGLASMLLPDAAAVSSRDINKSGTATASVTGSVTPPTGTTRIDFVILGGGGGGRLTNRGGHGASFSGSITRPANGNFNGITINYEAAAPGTNGMANIGSGGAGDGDGAVGASGGGGGSSITATNGVVTTYLVIAGGGGGAGFASAGSANSGQAGVGGDGKFPGTVAGAGGNGVNTSASDTDGGQGGGGGPVTGTTGGAAGQGRTDAGAADTTRTGAAGGAPTLSGGLTSAGSNGGAAGINGANTLTNRSRGGGGGGGYFGGGGGGAGQDNSGGGGAGSSYAYNVTVLPAYTVTFVTGGTTTGTGSNGGRAGNATDNGLSGSPGTVSLTFS